MLAEQDQKLSVLVIEIDDPAKLDGTFRCAASPRQDHEDRQRECGSVLGSLNFGGVPARGSMSGWVVIDDPIVG